jgi:DNA polymerase-1
VKRVLLIDADIIAYKAAASQQTTVDWNGDGVRSVSSDLAECAAIAKEELDFYMDTLKADSLVICLSDDFQNFRNKVDPTYKTNRSSSIRPEELYPMKDWLKDAYPSRRIGTLEADDILGMMATEPNTGEERVMVSMDKDLKTIPGLLYRPQEPHKGIQTITLEAADRYHLLQTLIGDATDGYSGCPGVGPVAAEFVLSGRLWMETPRLLRSGPRKGLEVKEWVFNEGHDNIWACVVSAYTRAGLTEADALRQARLARILRHGDWDGGKVRLWEPR